MFKLTLIDSGTDKGRKQPLVLSQKTPRCTFLSTILFGLGVGGGGGGGGNLPRGGKIMSRVTWTDSGTEMLLLAA
jgi:hypothetical protein